MSHTSLIPLFWDQRNFHTISYQLFTIFLFAFHLLLPDRYTKIVIARNLVLCSAVSESLANGIPTAWVYICAWPLEDWCSQLARRLACMRTCKWSQSIATHRMQVAFIFDVLKRYSNCICVCIYTLQGHTSIFSSQFCFHASILVPCRVWINKHYIFYVLYLFVFRELQVQTTK